MPTYDDVARLAAELPEVTEGTEKFRGHRAWLVAGKAGFFTIEHFGNYTAYLIELDAVTPADLREALVDGWLAVAPPPLAEEFLRQ